MSRAMDEAMRLQELGLCTVPETNVCRNHINEPAIKNFIRRTSTSGYCDYCEKSTSVVSLEDLMEFIMEAVLRSYTDPANFMRYETSEGGYLGNVYNAEEILQEHFDLDIEDLKLSNDVFQSLDLTKPWSDEMQFYDSPSDILLYNWKYFKEIVKHRSRYFFGLVKDLNSDNYPIQSDEMLAEIGSSIKKFKLIKKLNVGTKFYRCRQHSRGDSSVSNPKGMTSPPQQFAIQPNRMSPSGISMFYGAFDIETALRETLDVGNKEIQYFTTVAFSTIRELNVVDLSMMPLPPSPFDAKKHQDRFRLIFIKNFIKDLTAPINRDGRIHIDYVPTQIITEYLRFPFSDKLSKHNRIDGIIYPSSRNGKKACVLFFDNEESLKVLNMDNGSLNTTKINKKKHKY
ncbi:RES domain-containing protein [Paenimyroides ummariense]|uniref:RES domain-containing protein n=1 Tax=Paenimyroides ummariense TaxID=913024 RepID=A0A1I5CV65_9FLAO|nr:HEPN-associated N-terminal domain-containing protein [Paenimyroides ummariense]SFN90849.1 RES domain-containing protein [Paenimyroides ummariense]